MAAKQLYSRYAEACYQYAKSEESLEQVCADMSTLRAVYAQSVPLRQLLDHLGHTPQTKKNALEKTLSAHLHPTTRTCLHYLIAKRRASALDGIAEAFITRYHQHKHIRTVHLTTAKAISQAVQERLIQHVQKLLPKPGKVLLIPHVDPSLIGGYVLTFADKELDMSLRTQLTRLQHHWKFASL